LRVTLPLTVRLVLLLAGFTFYANGAKTLA
jgi:hypothetical protein